MHQTCRLAMLSLIATAVMAVAPSRAMEPAAPYPDSLWDEPLFAGTTPNDDDLRFLPPVTLDHAEGAAAVAPAAGGARSVPAPPATPYVAAGRRGDVRAPAASFPDGVLSGPQMTLNPEGDARVTVIPELGAGTFGTTVRGGGVSVQGGSSRVGVGVGVGRDETGRTSGGLGVTLTFP